MTKIRTNLQNNLHHYIFLLVLIIGMVFVQGGLQRNLSSLRYLWQEPSAGRGIQGIEQITQFNQRAHLWQAQDAFRADDIALAEEKVGPLLAANQFDAPYLRQDTMRLYGAILAENGDYEQAFTIWRDLKDIDSLQGFANRATEEGQLTIALQAYEIAQALDPQAGAHRLAHFLWINLKEPDEAETVLRDALNQFPYSGEQQPWLHLLGRIYRSQERWADAIPLYELLLELNNNDATAALQIGHIKADRNDGLADIMAQYQLAIQADPDRGDGYFAIGQLFVQSSEFQMADGWLEGAVSRNPKSLSWQLAYAANARDLGSTEMMIKRYEQIQTAFPDNHRAQMDAAWGFYLAGLNNEAKLAMDNALRLAGSNPPAWYLDRAKKIYAE